MFARGPARSRVTLAILLVAGLAGAAPNPGGVETTASQPFPPADARRAPGGKDTPEVIALLRQRREVVKAELDQASKLIGDRNFRADVWSALAERLLVADTDLAETPAELVAAYRTFRDNLKLMEDQLKRVPEPLRGQGFFEYGQKLWIHCRRLQAEVSLLRAELAKAETASASDEPPAVQEALFAWRDSVRQWAKMWLESRVPLIPAFAREIAATALGADLAAAKDSAETIAAYQAYRDRLLTVEKTTKTEVERRQYNAYDYLRIKEMRCDADVVLGRLKVAGDKSSDKDPPEVRAALEDWVQAIGYELEVNRKRYAPSPVPPAESLAVDDSVLREELSAATKPEERIAAYKKFLGKLKEAEVAVKAHSGEKSVGREEAARATFNRAAAELSLLQLTTGSVAKTSPEAKALLKEQRDALRVELSLRMAEWAAGQGDFQLLQESAGHLLLTNLDLADTAADRIAAYQAHADRMRLAEDNCKALLAEKKGSEAWLLWTRGARLEAEVWLLRAKGNLTAATKSTP